MKWVRAMPCFRICSRAVQFPLAPRRNDELPTVTAMLTGSWRAARTMSREVQLQLATFATAVERCRSLWTFADETTSGLFYAALLACAVLTLPATRTIST